MTAPVIQPATDEAAMPATESRLGVANGMSAGGGRGLLLVAVLFVGACLGHGLLQQAIQNPTTPIASSLAADTAWFSLTGLAFVLVTLASHTILCRQAQTTPLAPLMIAMMVRLAGTFLILGCLLAISPLSRPEAVFNVLFWYITLTAADLIGVTQTR